MTGPAIGVVAGSGLELAAILDEIDREIAFSEVGRLRPTAVAGHAGRFLCGRSGSVATIVQCGRLHAYEGLGLEEVVETVAVLAELGARSVIFTNAAGGLLPDMRAGELMSVDSIRLWPYRAWPDQPAEIEPDFAIDGCSRRGPYHWVHGPCYETRAEIAALRAMNSAAVGMSTAAEMHHAQALGMRAAAVSCITNNCCTPHHLTHDHVLSAAAASSPRLCELLRAAIAEEATGWAESVSRTRAPSSQ